MPIIDEFESSLSKHSRPSYAQWRPVDLHNHSPASFDYEGNKADAITAAISHLSTANLDVVMFTDHHTLPEQAFIEAVRRGTGKTILRGAELNVFVDAWGKPQQRFKSRLSSIYLSAFLRQWMRIIGLHTLMKSAVTSSVISLEHDTGIDVSSRQHLRSPDRRWSDYNTSSFAKKS